MTGRRACHDRPAPRPCARLQRPAPHARLPGPVRRVVLTLRADAVEDLLDELLPLLPQGVYERALDDGRAEVVFYGDTPDGPALDALAGSALLARDEEEVRDGAEERRHRAGHAWEIGGRLRVRAPADPPGEDALREIVIEPVTGAFGTGAHP